MEHRESCRVRSSGEVDNGGRVMLGTNKLRERIEERKMNNHSSRPLEERNEE